MLPRDTFSERCKWERLQIQWLSCQQGSVITNILASIPKCPWPFSFQLSKYSDMMLRGWHFLQTLILSFLKTQWHKHPTRWWCTVTMWYECFVHVDSALEPEYLLHIKVNTSLLILAVFSTSFLNGLSITPPPPASSPLIFGIGTRLDHSPRPTGWSLRSPASNEWLHVETQRGPLP